jgi:hypothetical protein
MHTFIHSFYTLLSSKIIVYMYVLVDNLTARRCLASTTEQLYVVNNYGVAVYIHK